MPDFAPEFACVRGVEALRRLSDASTTATLFRRERRRVVFKDQLARVTPVYLS